MTNNTEILSNIRELKTRFSKARPDFQQIIDDLEKRARAGIIKARLYEHEEIKKIVNDLAGVVNSIDAALTNDETILNDEGKKLLYRKRMYEGFIDIFVKSPEQLKQVSGEVEAILNANKDNS